MKSSRANLIRPSRRVWVSPSGRLIDDMPAIPPKPAAPQKVDWEAYVVDTSTNQANDTYPRLTGHDAVSNEPHEAARDIKVLYLDKLRFADTKVDIEVLKTQINAGVHDVHVDIKEQAEEPALSH